MVKLLPGFFNALLCVKMSCVTRALLQGRQNRHISSYYKNSSFYEPSKPCILAISFSYRKINVFELFKEIDLIHLQRNMILESELIVLVDQKRRLK
jgi:hypothetical protein